MPIKPLTPILAAIALLATPAIAAAELIPLGTASGGNSIRLDSSSVRGNGGTGWGQDFVYYLGKERIQASANCKTKVWYVGNQTYKPQSKATKDMMDLVCSANLLNPDKEDVGQMFIFAPPSNIRRSPSTTAPVICAIAQKEVIQVYPEPRGEWFMVMGGGCRRKGSLDSLGGWIHQSQLKPF